MGAGTGRLPRRDVFHPGLSFRLYERRDGSGRYPGRKQSRDNIEILRNIRFSPSSMQYKPMIITEEEQASFDAATTCWICGGETIDDDGGLGKVRDHCHFTGKYRGAAHNKWNLKLGKDKTIPVVFHNGSRYDFHLFVRSLGRIEGHIKTIATNSE